MGMGMGMRMDSQLQHHASMQRARVKRQATTCTLYGHPQAGETVPAYEPFAITWDCACLGTAVKDIDITLYSYGGGALHAWTDVPCSDNSLTTTFKPNWWNSTLTAQLQLQITESDQPVWATTTGLGPAFGASWNGTTPASATPGNGTQSGVSIESIRADDETGGLASGKLAAAVTVPLLAAALGIAAYIFYSRRKVKVDRRRWSAVVDQRMSHYSAATGAHSPGGGSGSRPSMQSRAHSRYSSMAGSPEKGNATMQENGNGRPSLASRPISGYSLASVNNNFAGVGSTMRMPPTAAQFPTIAGGDEGHNRVYSTSGFSAVGSQADGRPASSFYALDGHSTVETPSDVGAPSARRHLGNKSLTSNSRPQSELSRAAGTGVGDRVSRVSFADSSFTGGAKEGGGNRRSSYFANGPGTASSPNSHKYKSSQGNSVSGNSIFNMYGGSNSKDTPAMPRIPIPALYAKDRDVTRGVEASTARALSAEDLAGIISPKGPTSPDSFETAALPASRSADGNLGPFENDNTDYLSPPNEGNTNKKHSITLSTSMPRLANPQGRQSILSPDDMLKAYAAKTAIAGPSPRPLMNSNNSQHMTSSMSVPTMGNNTQQRPDTFMSDTSKYADEDLDEFAPVHAYDPAEREEETLSSSPQYQSSPSIAPTISKKGVFNTKFKFGSAK